MGLVPWNVTDNIRRKNLGAKTITEMPVWWYIPVILVLEKVRQEDLFPFYKLLINGLSLVEETSALDLRDRLNSRSAYLDSPRLKIHHVHN